MKAAPAQKFSAPIKAGAVFCVAVWLLGSVVMAVEKSCSCCQTPKTASCGHCPPKSVGAEFDPQPFNGLRYVRYPEPCQDHRDNPCGGHDFCALIQAALQSTRPLSLGQQIPPLWGAFAPKGDALRAERAALLAARMISVPPDWLLTPEERLGPALRGLAPPFLA